MPRPEAEEGGVDEMTTTERRMPGMGKMPDDVKAGIAELDTLNAEIDEIRRGIDGVLHTMTVMDRREKHCSLRYRWFGLVINDYDLMDYCDRRGLRKVNVIFREGRHLSPLDTIDQDWTLSVEARGAETRKRDWSYSGNGPNADKAALETALRFIDEGFSVRINNKDAPREEVQRDLDKLVRKCFKDEKRRVDS